MGIVEQLFAGTGLEARISGAGLITRQLIARLGGVDGGRVFKIPGASPDQDAWSVFFLHKESGPSTHRSDRQGTSARMLF